MKKTLNEEKERILTLIREFHGTGYPRGESEYVPKTLSYEEQLEDILRKCVDSGKSLKEVRRMVEDILDVINSELPPEEKREIPMDNDTSVTKTGAIMPGIGSM